MAEVDRPRRRRGGKKGGAPRRARRAPTDAALAGVARVLGAVAAGDLSQAMALEVNGAPIDGALLRIAAALNEMIASLRETSRKSHEQDWLKGNLARLGGMMQGHKTLQSVGRMIMSELAPLVQASHGAFFVVVEEADGPCLELLATYAYRERKHVATRFRLGEGIVGQAALEKKSIVLTRVPADYVQITSGLGEAPPLNIVVIPVLFEGEARAVIELAGFEPFSAVHRVFLEQLAESTGVVLNMIGANMRTEELLQQSRSFAAELEEQSRELRRQQDELVRSNQDLEEQARTLRASEEMLREQQEELQQVNEELEEKATLLVEQNKAVEQKNREVEMARLAVEERAAQLALSSKYKSEFLANMSHELRTPLNSLLILARMLEDNKEGNLTDRQVEYARTIHAAGADLLDVINEVLDLSKVEAGKMEIVSDDVRIEDVVRCVERAFAPVAELKGLELSVTVSNDAPQTLPTDGQRLRQILRNLLANAFKFTEAGGVSLRVDVPEAAAVFSAPRLASAAEGVVAFSVVDTGIGIASDKQDLIFEAFQQADGTTSRRYGGTGLGLSISRELARLLGGELRVDSEPGRGSTFTLLLPTETPEATSARETVPAPDPGERAPSRPVRVAAPAADGALAGKTALVVDDDVRNIYGLATVLEEAGMSVAFAENGADALAALAKAPDIAVVLVDVTMPETDGLETIRRIRAAARPELPVVALGAQGTPEERERCLAAGASERLSKPLKNDALLSRVRALLRTVEAA